MFLSDIVEYFKEKCSHEDESLPDSQTTDPNETSLEEKVNPWLKMLKIDDGPEDVMSNWDRDVTDPGYGAFPDAIHETSVDSSMSQGSSEEENEEADAPTLLAYRDFVFRSPAYEWLLASLRREFLLAPAEPNYMETIKQEIVRFLPSSSKVSRKSSAENYKMIFVVEWDPLAFVNEQLYKGEPGEAVGAAITLTGSIKDAQAITCAQYLCQTWPAYGDHIIRLVKDVLCSGPDNPRTCKFSGLKWSLS